MAEISAEVMQQLEQAQADIANTLEAQGPPVEVVLTADAVVGAAGSGVSKHVLLDHYFNSSTRRLWAHSGEWRHRNVTTAEEQGVAQVAFLADRVDVWWDSNNSLTMLRCWKNF